MIFNMGDGGSGAKSDITAHKNKNLCLVGTVPSALKINAVEGESVQDGTPTPAVPVDIKSVVVSEIKTTGKNLINQKCVGTSLATPIWLKNGTYTVSRDASETNGAWYFKATTKDNAIITSNALEIKYATLNSSGEWYYAGTSAISYTFIVLVDCYVTIASINGSGNTYLMLAEGSVALQYEPYTESLIQLSAPITLRGIGDVKDAICKQNGVYGVLRNFDSIILNGTEVWSAIASNRVFTSAIASNMKKPTDNILIARGFLCSHYGLTPRQTIANNTFAVETTGNVMFMDNTNATSLETWKAWLSANNVTVDYQLATPVFTPLPEADQIALKQLETFDKTTYVFTDSEVEAVIEVECATSKTGGLLFDVESDMGGCKLKYENGKFYIGYDDGTIQTEV